MSASPTTNIPTLESGDRLTRHEFERRYQVKVVECLKSKKSRISRR